MIFLSPSSWSREERKDFFGGDPSLHRDRWRHAVQGFYLTVNSAWLNVLGAFSHGEELLGIDQVVH
jgi:hypothetical protein